MKKYMLLTGATGQVGQYLVRDLLLEGQSLAVLVRGRDKETAEDRLDHILRRWESELHRKLPRPVCLEGDITLPHCGLNLSAHNWIADHVDSIIHNAASLTFIGSDRTKDPWLSNLTGTQNVLDVCRETGLRKMHYVSTAYVSGTRTTLVHEDELDCGQEFRNDYERCKFEAELLVRAADLDSLTVYRPAMIVGDTRTGYTATYHGLYNYLQFAYVLTEFLPRDESGRCHVPIRLDMTGDEGRNFVPIDWVSSVMTHILLHPEYHNRTYHLTPIQQTPTQAVEGAAARRLNFYGPTYVGPDGLKGQELNEIEKQFHESVTTYQPYWRDEPKFDSSNTQKVAPHLLCPTIDEDFIVKMLDFAIEDRWGRGKAKERKPKKTAPKQKEVR